MVIALIKLLLVPGIAWALAFAIAFLIERKRPKPVPRNQLAVWRYRAFRARPKRRGPVMRRPTYDNPRHFARLRWEASR